MHAGVGVACVDCMPCTNWRQSDLSLACTYHSPPWCGMPATLSSLQTVDLKDCDGLPWPETAPVNCVVSATWGYLAFGIRAMCPNQRNRHCASKEANGLTWQVFQMCCKLCRSETRTPMIPLKQLLYADSNRCCWDCITFQVSAPYTKCGTTKVLNTCTLAPSPKCLFCHTAENWAKAPNPWSLWAFTSAIKLSFEVKIPPQVLEVINPLYWPPANGDDGRQPLLALAHRHHLGLRSVNLQGKLLCSGIHALQHQHQVVGVSRKKHHVVCIEQQCNMRQRKARFRGCREK